MHCTKLGKDLTNSIAREVKDTIIKHQTPDINSKLFNTQSLAMECEQTISS